MNLPGRVLLVEDDPVDAELARDLLRTGLPGCLVVDSGTVAGAAAILGSEPFDVVLLDLRLPDARGTDALRRILRAGGTVPVVVLTSVADDEMAAEMVCAGADAYLVKWRLGPESLAQALRCCGRG